MNRYRLHEPPRRQIWVGEGHYLGQLLHKKTLDNGSDYKNSAEKWADTMLVVGVTKDHAGTEIERDLIVCKEMTGCGTIVHEFSSYILANFYE